jgi:hypothetical protein
MIHDVVSLSTPQGDYVYLLKHVDDCTLAGPKHSTLLKTVREDLAKLYTITTELEPSNFVGLAISRDRASH